MAENDAYDEGFRIVGGESGGKVSLTEEGRRFLGINKKVIKETEFFNLVSKKGQKERRQK